MKSVVTVVFSPNTDSAIQSMCRYHLFFSELQNCAICFYHHSHPGHLTNDQRLPKIEFHACMTGEGGKGVVEYDERSSAPPKLLLPPPPAPLGLLPPLTSVSPPPPPLAAMASL